MLTSVTSNPHGVEVRPDGSVRFRLWAPACSRPSLVLSSEDQLLPAVSQDGWFEWVVGTRAGARYQFELTNGLRVPDPASRFQPEGVHGPSEVVDPRNWAWSDEAWRGRPWDDAVIYELHIGVFTPEGTFRAAVSKLDHLRDLGATAIQLMPIADFPGGRNWGYDGVLPYAPARSYGRPEDLKALVEAAHARGIMVLLDVVYNHFGPDGNYLPLYAPQFFTDRHKTPWGAAVNFDGPDARPVREFVIQNALYWIGDYRFDGLRMDAVHQIRDDSSTHILQELASRVRRAFPDRHVHLLLENEENEAHWLERDGSNRPKLYTAQWNDDVHHGLHTAATGEGSAYYSEYLDDTGKLARGLAEGFAFQGEMMTYRGSARGAASHHLPPSAFVAFLQNHDQVGNRAFGDRMSARSEAAYRAVATTYLLLPQIPMLFMGEEWKASSPFLFFCDFGAELGGLVRQGRRAEFARFPEFQDPARRELIPDPQADETFQSSKLRWDEIATDAHSRWLDWYRRIIGCRRESIDPLARKIQAGGEYRVISKGAISVRWTVDDSLDLFLGANLSDQKVLGLPSPPAVSIWTEGDVGEEGYGPWAVAWWVEGRRSQ